MFATEIEDLIRLRMIGYSYSAIGKAMHISKNTLMSYCRNHGIVSDAKRKTKAENATLGNCKYCGRVIETDSNGSTRIFCSTACRKASWEEKNFNTVGDCILKDTPPSKERLAFICKKSDELVRKEDENE